MKHLLAFFLFLFLIFETNAQNLIPNGDFEIYSICPSSHSQTFRAVPWFDPAANLGGGSDYLNVCAPVASGVNVPNNGNGFQYPASGDGYCGLYLYYQSIENSREYISTPTTSPLVAGQCYYFSMYVNLANTSKYTTDAIQIYFSNTATTSLPMPGIMNVTPQVFNTPGNIPDSTNWTFFSGTFTATGGEQYVTIGNFLPDTATTLIQVLPVGGNHSYLHVDLVSLTVCTGIANHTSSPAISLLPDYNSQSVTVRIFRPGNYNVRLFDLTGRTLSNTEISTDTNIPIQQYSQGIIFYSVTENGKLISNGKLFLK